LSVWVSIINSLKPLAINKTKGKMPN